MQLKTFLMLTGSTLLLTACNDNSTPAPISCNDPALESTLSTTINNIITTDAKAFASSDNRQFIDADKIIAAVSGLTYRISDVQAAEGQTQGSCRATLDIQVPSETLTKAENNSPLIYGETPFAQMLQQKIGTTAITFQSGTLHATIPYAIRQENNSTRIELTDTTPNNAAQILSTALLPYGVKDILLINGQAINRETALEALRNPPAIELPPTATDDLEDFINNLPEQEDAPEMLSPESNQQDEVSFSESEFAQAKHNNHNADQDINRLWKRLDPEIQQSLLDEQRSWIRKKDSSCRQAAAAATTTLQAEYLQMQCDTRMTRERIEYLKGYTIN